MPMFGGTSKSTKSSGIMNLCEALAGVGFKQALKSPMQCAPSTTRHFPLTLPLPQTLHFPPTLNSPRRTPSLNEMGVLPGKCAVCETLISQNNSINCLN